MLCERGRGWEEKKERKKMEESGWRKSEKRRERGGSVARETKIERSR